MISSSLHAHYAVIVQVPLCHQTSLPCNSAQHLMYSSVRMRECLGAVWQLLPEIIIVPRYSRAEVKGALLACQEANFLLH